MSKKDVIIALDFPTREETLSFLDRFPAGEKPFVKIGMELYYAEGPAIVREIKARGHKIFLDLKLHDIPNTVKRAMAVLSRLDVDMVNLHAAGTSAMMKAALEGLTRPDGTRPMLIAVTQLTSTDAAALKDELLIGAPMAETVLSYAKNAAASGLDGVVCSPLEAALVKERCGESFCTVTPGVRFAGGSAGDQKRIMTPEAAGKNGCDYIVVGRPITQAADPVAAYWKALLAFRQGYSTLAGWLDIALAAPLPPSVRHLAIHLDEEQAFLDCGGYPAARIWSAQIRGYQEGDDPEAPFWEQSDGCLIGQGFRFYDGGSGTPLYDVVDELDAWLSRRQDIRDACQTVAAVLDGGMEETAEHPAYNPGSSGGECGSVCAVSVFVRK